MNHLNRNVEDQLSALFCLGISSLFCIAVVGGVVFLIYVLTKTPGQRDEVTRAQDNQRAVAIGYQVGKGVAKTTGFVGWAVMRSMFRLMFGRRKRY